MRLVWMFWHKAFAKVDHVIAAMFSLQTTGLCRGLLRAAAARRGQFPELDASVRVREALDAVVAATGRDDGRGGGGAEECEALEALAGALLSSAGRAHAVARCFRRWLVPIMGVALARIVAWDDRLEAALRFGECVVPVMALYPHVLPVVAGAVAALPSPFDTLAAAAAATGGCSPAAGAGVIAMAGRVLELLPIVARSAWNWAAVFPYAPPRRARMRECICRMAYVRVHLSSGACAGAFVAQRRRVCIGRVADARMHWSKYACAYALVEWARAVRASRRTRVRAGTRATRSRRCARPRGGPSRRSRA